MEALFVLLFFLVVNGLRHYYTTEQKLRKKSKAFVLAEEAVELRRQAKQLQSPATFSKAALLERRAIKLDKQIEDLRLNEAPQVNPNFLNGLRTLKIAVAGAMAYQQWGTPLLHVPLEPVALMSGRLSFPHGWPTTEGLCGVSVLAWLILCESASGAVIAAVDSLVRR